MRTFVVGDIHGNPSIISNANWPEAKDLSEDDVVIFLGDYGMYWSNPEDKEEAYWSNWLAAKPFTVCFLDGNHENFDIINEFPTEEKWGGTVGVNYRKGGNIYHLKRGEVYDINGHSIFTLGGALSIDKHLRSEGFSWWAQEQHSKAEEDNALDNLDKVNWKVDHVLTHTCPDDIIYAFLDNPTSEKFRDPVARFLNFIDNRLEFKLWSFGHFHNDRLYNRADGGKFQCHYNIIRELT